MKKIIIISLLLANQVFAAAYVDGASKIVSNEFAGTSSIPEASDSKGSFTLTVIGGGSSTFLNKPKECPYAYLGEAQVDKSNTKEKKR